MMRTTLGSAIVLLLIAPLCSAQDQQLDDISQQATTLEGELNKYKDTAPQAAPVMVKLVDLYHTSGRVFGLVRVSQRYAAAHPTDQHHKAVMLKLIDGLQALSRNQDLIVACRQFLERYPKDAASPDVEIRLADTLRKSDDRSAAAAAHQAVWRRQPTSDIGKRYGVTAVRLFTENQNNASVAQGAALAQAMLDKLPKGGFANQIGWRSFRDWYRIGKYAECNLVGNRLLAAKLVTSATELQELHRMMSDAYRYLGQYANSVKSMRAARAAKDSQALHFALIERMNEAKSPTNEMSNVVKDYVQKYPQAENRLHGLSRMAHRYLEEGDVSRGLTILKTLLIYDPAYNNNASAFITHNGSEPNQLQATERELLAAINKAQRDRAYLRYLTGFTLYRDRLKDNAKARQILRQMLSDSPPDNQYSQNAIGWLLQTAESDAEFNQEVAFQLKVRRDNLHAPYVRDYLKAWVASAKRQKDLRDRANYVQNELAKANKDPVVALSLGNNFQHRKQEAAVRAQLLAPQMRGKLSPKMLDRLLETQAYYQRHYSNERAESATLYGELARRHPQNFAHAVSFLAAATDYAPPEVCQEAALHMLKQKAEPMPADVWRRLCIAADKAENKDLLKTVFRWILDAQKQFGPDPQYASYIGDTLKKHELQTEAIAYWTTYMDHDVNHSESYECARRLHEATEDAAAKQTLAQRLFARNDLYQGRYATWLAQQYLTDQNLDAFQKVLRESEKRQRDRPLTNWNLDGWSAVGWVNTYRQTTDEKMTDDQRKLVFTVIQDLNLGSPSASATLALTELAEDKRTAMQKMLDYQHATMVAGDTHYAWDPLMSHAQAAIARQDYPAAATLATGMLANVRNVDANRQQAARNIVTQAYGRMGNVGMTIDEDSPIAPLLQAALYLRLGDNDLAFETYEQNKPLFDQHRLELPVDLLVFVCDKLIAAGGDDNHDYVEDILRSWLVKNSESEQIEDSTKAKMQLLLGRNYFKARRFDIARSEFTTTLNRYPNTPEAVEAEFGIGEAFMAQKVFDQAEAVFEKLAQSVDNDIVIRAEFLRGVLTFRRGDRDDARDIFRSVLERVPNVKLANQALFNLAEVYGSEERYIEQLNLLRTVGRLGRISKRRHLPGTALSIVVHDSDLGISRGHNRIPVIVTTKPGGDSESVFLTSAGAGKGLFRVDLETMLGDANADDGVLQLTGVDSIHCDYPDDFKSEFKYVPLSDVDITIAASADFTVASSRIVDEEAETFSERLERQQRDNQEADQRVSQTRPDNQIKPGNPIYLRVQDADRDISNETDVLPLKLVANSGDVVQVNVVETGPHTGIFEGTAKTAELPAGALASDTAIEHNPLMAIDQKRDTYWMSEPDGATPKSLTVDMKDLHDVARVRLATPDPENKAPVRVDLLGSHDGEFWFRVASQPQRAPIENMPGAFGKMQQKVFRGNYTSMTSWPQALASLKNAEPVEAIDAESMQWSLPEEDEEAKKAHAVVWQGHLHQLKDGAVRVQVKGAATALLLDGREELLFGKGNRSVDLWLTKGLHELTIFAATSAASSGVEASWARADLNSSQVSLVPFRATDFDIPEGAQPAPGVPSTPPTETPADEPQVDPEGTLALSIDDVTLQKKSAEFAVQEQNDVKRLTQWTDLEDSASWSWNANAAGVYELYLDCSHNGNGGDYWVEFADQKIRGTVVNTGNDNTFRQVKVGNVLVAEPGEISLTLKPITIEGAGLMNLKGILLKPTTQRSVIMFADGFEFRFPQQEIRYARLQINEYLGEAVAISNVEIGGNAIEERYIPTDKDVLSLATNEVLEIAAGDLVTASYTDEFTQTTTGGSQLLTKQLTATYNNATVTPIAYDFARAGGGAVTTSRKELMRVDPGDRVTVEITDYDADTTNEQDSISFVAQVNDGPVLQLVATETDTNTGVFTKEIDTTESQEEGKLTIAQGDHIFLRYIDSQNTFPGHSVPRESVVYVNEPTEGQIRIYESQLGPQPSDPGVRPNVTLSPPAEDAEISGVAFAAPLTIEVIDPDAAKDSRSTVTVKVKTTDGAVVDVECVLSTAFATRQAQGTRSWALEEGRFIGQVTMQLGGKDSPQLVPLTLDMPRGLIGRVYASDKKDEEENLGRDLVARVLNLTGKDLVVGGYFDERHPSDEGRVIGARARLVTDGILAITDRDYDEPVKYLHVGEKIYLQVHDPDQDTTDERDTIEVVVTSELGENETVTLYETLAHSGVFTASFALRAADTPEPNNLDPAEPELESYFGDNLTVRYTDPKAPREEATAVHELKIPVVVGTDGLVSAFTKTFNDETLAVETKFRIAESYFELFKSHKDLERANEQKTDLEAGRRVLREVMEDFPDPKYAPRIAYLLGQFAQELEQWEEAIRSYEMIIRQYPDHTLAADAQYKLAQSYEEAGDFDEALEAYVTLAATYPKSPLIASVMIRICDYFYKEEDFVVAAQVGEKFMERFPGHEHAAKLAFRVGQCYYKSEEYVTAGESFDKFSKVFPDDALNSDALFWAGESYRLAKNNAEAFRRYNNCRWKYQESEAAKYARGRLALPEMLQQFEAEAASIDSDN